jgi:uncharacterized protein (TIRG00374 family)
MKKSASPAKKIVIAVLKISISVGIVAYLVWNTVSDEEKGNAFAHFWQNNKDWWLLALAWAFQSAAVFITFVRWWYLVRSLDVPCRFRDALRISFWGYLFNFLPLGIVSGDVLKIVMLAHEQPKHKAKGATSVVVDRAIGLYVLFLVASLGILLTGAMKMEVSPKVILYCQATLAVTLAGTLGIVLVMIPAVIDGKLVRWMERLPKVGRVLENLLDAVRMYRSKPKVLFYSSLMTIPVHCLIAFSVYLIAQGLPGEIPSLGLHYVIVPLCMATQVIPISIGPLEIGMTFLYEKFAAASNVAIPYNQGFIIALCYRVSTVLVLLFGLRYFLTDRQEVREAMMENDE